jgi:hypothetical protein
MLTIDFSTAHPNQKELYKSQNESLSDEECDAAYQVIKETAGEGIDKVMEVNEFDVIVTNSDCELVVFAAYTGESTSFASFPCSIAQVNCFISMEERHW